MNNKPTKYNKGQAVVAAIISGLALLGASVFTAWATAGARVSQIDTRIQVVEERENNHYLEVRDLLNRMDKKLDKVIDQQ